MCLIVSLVVSVLCEFLTFNFINKTSFNDVDSVEIELEGWDESYLCILSPYFCCLDSMKTPIFFSIICFFCKQKDIFGRSPRKCFFYLVLPFIVIAIYFLRSFSTMLSWLLCVVIMGVFLGFPEIVGIRLYGYDHYTPPYLGWFMIGIFVAYLTSAIKTSSIQISSNKKECSLCLESKC